MTPQLQESLQEDLENEMTPDKMLGMDRDVAHIVCIFASVL